MSPLKRNKHWFHNMSKILLPYGKAFIHDREKEGVFKILFRYKLNEGKDVKLTFHRSKDEMLSETISRMQLKLQSIQKDSSAKKMKFASKLVAAVAGGSEQRPSSSVIEPELTGNDNICVKTVDGTELPRATTTNAHAFLTDGNTLQINDQIFEVVIRNAYVKNLKIDHRIFVDFPVLPKVKVSEFCQKVYLQWFVTDDTGSPDEESSYDFETFNATVPGYKKLTEPTLEPSGFICDKAHLGSTYAIVASPLDENDELGIPLAFNSPNEVEARPNAIFDNRHKSTLTYVPQKMFRAISYNILSDLYVKPGPEGFFPYCDPKVITHEYRYPFLLKEIEGYHADIICLQECDLRFYKSFLTPFMNPKGYVGDLESGFSKKAGDVNEGCALLFREEKFSQIDVEHVVLADLFECQEHEDLAKMCAQIQKTKELIETRPTCCQIVVLRFQDEPENVLIVGNTHLFFHRDWPHVKLIQIALCIRRLEAMKRKIQNQMPDARVSVVFCGDFNATQTTGAYIFAATGEFPADHEDWDKGSDGEQRFHGKELRHDLGFRPAYSEELPYTNYTTGFYGHLDHIFITNKIGVERTIPLPKHEDVIKYQAIPSPECPSDHLALIADLRFT